MQHFSVTTVCYIGSENNKRMVFAFRRYKMADIIPAIIVAIIFICVVYWIKIISDNRVRLKLIEKGLVDEKAKYLYPSKTEFQGPASLKWGIVLIAVGLACLSIVVFQKEEVFLASIFLFPGIGLVVYYLVARALAREEETGKK